MIESYEIKTDELSVKILNYGATIADICFRGRHMVLRFADLENYRNPKLNQAFGSTVGRFANRIANGQLFLGNQEYSLEQNDGPNCLHGGSHGFAHRFWSLVSHGETELLLRLQSDHLDQEFPGSIVVDARFSVHRTALTIDYSAKLSDDCPPDARTVVNLTNHAYFNLNGCEPAEVAGTPTILNHEVHSGHAKAYLEQDANKVPTKRLIELQRTSDAQMRISEGFVMLADGCAQGLYDHSFVFETDVDRYTVDAAGDRQFAFDLVCRPAGIKLGLRTNNYSCHLYTGPRERIANYAPFSGVCLEAQSFPNACNVPEWLRQCLLKKSQTYSRTICYSFEDLP